VPARRCSWLNSIACWNPAHQRVRVARGRSQTAQLASERAEADARLLAEGGEEDFLEQRLVEEPVVHHAAADVQGERHLRGDGALARRGRLQQRDLLGLAVLEHADLVRFQGVDVTALLLHVEPDVDQLGRGAEGRHVAPRRRR
jgi:hypothetical protein